MENYENKYDVVSDIYDQYVAVDFDIPFWLEECKKAGEVLELTAGTGRITLPMVRAGLKVTALDISGALLNILTMKAEKEGLNLEVVRADMRNFKIHRRYPLVILPFQSIQELLTHQEQLKTLERISDHLNDDGNFIVSIYNPRHHGPDAGRSTLLKEFKDHRSGHTFKFFNSRTVNGHLATNEQVYREFSGSRAVSERKFINKSYVFNEGEFEALLKEAEFKVVQVWGGYKYEPRSDENRFLIYKLAKEPKN